MRIYLYAALGVAALAILGWFIYDQRSIGGAAERERQANENAKSVENAEGFAATFSDCRQRDGVYNFETGKCRVSVGGGWQFPSWLTR